MVSTKSWPVQVDNVPDTYTLDPSHKLRDYDMRDKGLFAATVGLDSDGDGIPDWREREIGTDPLKVDSRGDGQSDGAAYAANGIVGAMTSQDDDDLMDMLQPILSTCRKLATGETKCGI